MGTLSKSAPGSYQVTPDRRQRLIRARPGGRQINAKTPDGSFVSKGQTAAARTSRSSLDPAQTD